MTIAIGVTVYLILHALVESVVDFFASFLSAWGGPVVGALALVALGAGGLYLYRRWRNHAGLGLQPEGRFRASELARREFAFLRHHLQANELLVRSEQLAQHHRAVSVARIRTDRHLRRDAVYVGAGGAKVAVIPDAWVDLQLGDAQACIAFELDRGTERRKKVEAKLSALLAYSRGPYQEAFNTESLTIAWVVGEGPSGRADELLHWTEELLVEQGAEADGELFRVATFDPAAIDHDTMFLKPIWRQPFQANPVRLLEGGAGDA